MRNEIYGFLAMLIKVFTRIIPHVPYSSHKRNAILPWSSFSDDYNSGLLYSLISEEISPVVEQVNRFVSQ